MTMPAPMKSLASISESIRYGYTASASDAPVGPRFLRITDIVPTQIDWDKVPYCEIDENRKEKFSLVPGDIVVARTGTVGYAKLIRNAPDSVFASYLVRFRIDPKQADPEYVGRVIESDAYKKFVRAHVGGAAQPHANAKLLSAFRFPIPDRTTQSRIVDILSAYEDLMANNQRRIRLLEQAARLLYKEWFVRFRFPGHERVKIKDGAPDGWAQYRLSELLETQYGFTETASNEPVGPKFLRGTDINKTSYIDWSTVPYCPDEKLDYKKFALQIDDIVVIRMADPGKVAIVETEQNAVFASYLVRLTRKKGVKIPALYLFYALADDAYQGFISGASGGTTRKSASAKLLVDFSIVAPAHALLTTFVDKIQPLRQQIQMLLQQNSKLRQARDLLLPRLMNEGMA